MNRFVTAGDPPRHGARPVSGDARDPAGRGDTRFAALRGVDLQIGYGETVAVVGKSGSGRSTLMHLLALLDAPAHGTVALDGRPVASMTAREIGELRNAASGFVLQQSCPTPGQAGNLDPATGAVAQDILSDLDRERGIALVVVTHDEDLGFAQGAVGGVWTSS